MAEAKYAPAAKAVIEAVFDDPRLDQLAARLDEVLTLLDTDPGDARLRRHRMQTPKVWAVPVRGSGRDLVILWEIDDDGRPFVRYAGDAF